MFRPPLFFARALDITSSPAGRYAARLLGDMGAEVIRLSPEIDAGLDCNKYSCPLDLPSVRARAVLLRLAELSDIVVTDSPDDIGVPIDELEQQNERLIVVTIPRTDVATAAIAAAGAVGLALWDRRRTAAGGRVDVAATGAGKRRDGAKARTEPASMQDDVRDIPATPWRLSESPTHIRLPAPTPGEHRDYVLRELLGLTDDEVAALGAG